MYRTVFSVDESVPWDLIGFVAPGLLMLVVGILALRYSRGAAPAWMARIAEQLPRGRPMPKWFPYVFIAVAVIWLVLAGGGTFGTYLSFRKALASNHKVVEGVVDDFEPIPYSGKGTREESFVVDGVRFAYSDYRVTAAFNQTRSHGGPIREGLRVRIAYKPGRSGNPILKLEVAADGAPGSGDAASEKPRGRPPIPMAVLLPICAALSVFGGWLLFVSRNAALKRRWFPPLMIGSTLLFLAFSAQLGSVPWVFYLMVLLFTVLNLRSIAFCDSCGRTLHASKPWQRPGACPRCTGEQPQR